MNRDEDSSLWSKSYREAIKIKFIKFPLSLLELNLTRSTVRHYQFAANTILILNERQFLVLWFIVFANLSFVLHLSQ